MEVGKWKGTLNTEIEKWKGVFKYRDWEVEAIFNMAKQPL